MFVIYSMPNIQETMKPGIDVDIAMDKYDWHHVATVTTTDAPVAGPAPIGGSTSQPTEPSPSPSDPIAVALGDSSGKQTKETEATGLLTIRLDKTGTIVYTSPRKSLARMSPLSVNTASRTRAATFNADTVHTPDTIPAKTNQDKPPVSVDASAAPAEAHAASSSSGGGQESASHQKESVAHQQEQSQAQSKIDPELQKNVTAFWDSLQSKLKCCGLANKDEWLTWSPDKSSYPKSCCLQPSVTVLPNGTEFMSCKESPSSYTNCYARIETPIILLAVIVLLAVLASTFLSALGFLSGFRSHQFN